MTRSVISEEGFAFLYKVGAIEHRTYAVTPSCSTGPCDVSIDVTGSKSGKTSTLPFKWVDGTYRHDLVEQTTQFHCTKNGTTYKTLDETTSVVLQPILTALVDGKLVVIETKFTEHFSVAPTGAAKTAGCTPFSVDLVGTVTLSTGAAPTATLQLSQASPSATSAPAAALPAADRSCKKESTTESHGAVGETSYTIANHTTRTLTVYWLNYQGHREKWFDLAAGAKLLQDTYKTHPWLVAAPNGKCLRIFYAPAKIVIG